MSLKIRLSRGGAKKRPFYRIVIADSRSPRDGRFIERLGTFDPLKAKDAADRLEVEAVQGMKRQEVVDAYLIDVDVKNGVPVPRHFRERFKTLGPSVHPELGKQALFSAYARAAAE